MKNAHLYLNVSMLLLTAYTAYLTHQSLKRNKVNAEKLKYTYQ